jgi:hypothetical protein
MKKIFIATAIALLSVSAADACEICGCGLGNYYIGMLPQFSHKFFGIRYQYRNFHTIIADDPTQFSRDYYKTVELWGGWNIGKKWQVIALLPYNYIHEVSDDGVTNNQGIGDIAVMLNYKVFDKTSTMKKNKTFAQQLWFGGGIKIPTGKFNVDATDPDLVAAANRQTGTASTDFMLNTMYNVRINKLGINTSASYKMNTTNKDKYSFGNKFSANSIVYYTIKKGGIGFAPNLGITYENTAANRLQKEKVAQTGGNSLITSGGLEISFKRFTIGANLQLPLSQDFANGQTELKIKGMMHVTFSL